MGHMDLRAFWVMYSIEIKVYTLISLSIFGLPVLGIMQNKSYLCRIKVLMGFLFYMGHAGAPEGT